MSQSLNEVKLIGRLVADPELRYTPTARAVCNMRVATDEMWKDSTTGELKKKTEFHRITSWGDRAEQNAKYLAKGRLVLVQGKLTNRSYVDKDGVKRYVTEVSASNVTFLDSANKAKNQQVATDSPASVDVPI